MNSTTRIGIVFTLVALAACLLGYSFGPSGSGVFFKMLASCGFIATAVAAGALRGRYGRFILVGLFFSWWGDLFLAGGEDWFRPGLIAFWLAHAMYCVAYWGRRAPGAWTFEVAALLAIGGYLVFDWMSVKLPPDLRIPVIAYIAVISCMVTLAMSTQGTPGGRVLVWGAILFYVSDLFVARGRFVSPGPENALIGLPLYYAGQLFLAASIAYVQGPPPDRR